MKRVCCWFCVISLLVGSTALGLLRAYSIEPSMASLSGWTTLQNNQVSQIVTCSWDELDSASGAYVELFAGTMAGGGAYHVSVRTYPGDVPIASGNADGNIDHNWVKMRLDVIRPESIQRGHKLEFRFTRTDDSLHYYYQTGDQYSNQFGYMLVGSEHHTDKDLCMRVSARARVGDEFGVQSVIFWKNDGSGTHLESLPYDVPNWPACIARMKDIGVQTDKFGYGFWGIVQPSTCTTYKWDKLDLLMAGYATAGLQPAMHFEGFPGVTNEQPYKPCWADCYSSGQNGTQMHFARNLYYPALHDSNFTGRYVFEFVKRYGPRGGFWSANPQLPYRPITLYETYSEAASWQLRPWNQWSGPWIYEEGDRKIADSTYIAVYEKWRAIYPTGNENARLDRRRWSFLEVYARHAKVVYSAMRQAADSLGVPAESMPRLALYCPTMPDGEGFYLGQWLQGLEMFGLGDSFDIASYHPYYPSVSQQEMYLDSLRYYFRDGGS